MTVINRKADAWCDMKTATDSIHFHITVDLTALCEGMFEFLYGLVILTLFNIRWFWWSPLFTSIGLPYILAGIAASVDKMKFYKMCSTDFIFLVCK